MQFENSMASSEEEPVLGVYFEGNYDDTTSDSEASGSEDGGLTLGPDGLPQLTEKKSKDEHRTRTPRRNAEPVEVPKPHVEYEKRVPGPSTSIATISFKRLDRITKEHASRTDACLICARDATTAQPNISKLSQLPCGHAWCSECLARAFHFVLGQHAFGRLQCCTKEDIPLELFERIVENKAHPPVEYEVRPNPVATNANKTEDDKPWNSTKVIEYVEKDQEVFISPGDMASYRMLVEEHQAPSRSKVYCHGQGCGQYIPKDCRTKMVGKCVNCARRTCLRCRKSDKTHVTDHHGKCKASKSRIDSVNNEAKTLALAKRKGWKRCPRCRMFVQKERGGCSSVVCRCGRLFFYG